MMKTASKSRRKERLPSNVYHRKDGSYEYKYLDENHKRKSISAKSYPELLKRMKPIQDKMDRMKNHSLSDATLDECFKEWAKLKEGTVRANTYSNYIYMYQTFVSAEIGGRVIASFTRNDILEYYKYIIRKYEYTTSVVEQVDTVIRQVFDYAVDENMIPANPVLGIKKKALKLVRVHSGSNIHMQNEGIDTKEERRGLTHDELLIFLQLLVKEKNHIWLHVALVLIGTGMRASCLTGLRWDDIYICEGMNSYIDINHNIVIYNDTLGESGAKTKITVNKTKGDAGVRTIPMVGFVKAVLKEEAEIQELTGIRSKAEIGNYRDFVFFNRYGNPLSGHNINKAFRRILNEYNKEQIVQHGKDAVLLPEVSCHVLRHTFASRLDEIHADRSVHDVLMGHYDKSMAALYIYVDMDRKIKTMQQLDASFGDVYEVIGRCAGE